MVMKLLAGLLFAFAVYLAWWAISSAAWWWIFPAIVSLVGSVGLFQQKRWAQYIWHTITMVNCALWVLTVLLVVSRGWPYATLEESVISLVPGLTILAICIGGSVAIAKHARHTSIAR